MRNKQAKLRIGFWWRGRVVWTRWEGRRVSTGCCDAEAAYLWRAERERRRADPQYAAACSKTVDEAIRAHVRELKLAGRSAATLSYYASKLGHIRRVFDDGTAPLGSVVASSVQAFAEQRIKELAPEASHEDVRRARRTVKKELAALQSMLVSARHRGDYIHDVARVMPRRFDAPYVPVKRFLTPSEAAALVNTLLMWPRTRHIAGWVAFILATGARSSEVNRAMRVDVDEARSVVRVRGTKTLGSDRLVPIVASVRRFLDVAIEHGAGIDGRLFLALPSSNANRTIALACVRAGVPRVSPNDLRRTLASWLVQSGAATNLVAFVLGHTSSAMVERVYGRMTPEAAGELLRQSVRCDASVPMGQLSTALTGTPERSTIGNAAEETNGSN